MPLPSRFERGRAVPASRRALRGSTSFQHFLGLRVSQVPGTQKRRPRQEGDSPPKQGAGPALWGQGHLSAPKQSSVLLCSRGDLSFQVVAAWRSSLSDSWLGCGSVNTTKACSIFTGRCRAMGSPAEPLSALGRWYLYALHGYLAEVLFTASWDFALARDWRFRGGSSAWAPFIYGTCGLILERLFLHLQGRCNLAARGTLYTACIYLWEFSTGALLRHFGACPWDYSHFAYNLLGLVTLEYCGFWFVGSILLETLVIRYVLRLRLDGAGKPLRPRRVAFALRED